MSNNNEDAEKSNERASNILDAALNQSMFHREHEKFYSQSPLQQSVNIQRASGVLKTLADRWSNVKAESDPKVKTPYAGCPDLNEPAIIQHTGVLFMEGYGEPAEITRLKRDMELLAKDCEETGLWLSKAMESAWQVQPTLMQFVFLADVLGERHKIIANDWHCAHMQLLAARMIRRALEILQKIEFSPLSIRQDLEHDRAYPAYLYSASELLDTAADYFTDSARLVHDNERRWRVFRQRISQRQVT